MHIIEIIVIIACILIVGGVIFNYFYKKTKKMPTGECASCKSISSGSKLVKQYHKKYGKTQKSG